jgi:NADPH:quinone reductase-like Zn-dependent oxidoreductase
MPVFLILLAIAAPTVVWSVTYFLPLICMKLLGPQDLKKKYNAQWALVTGGSSGIGRAIVDRLAMQGLNVCVVSMNDDLLKNTVKELQSAFPKQVGLKRGQIDGRPLHISGDTSMHTF